MSDFQAIHDAIKEQYGFNDWGKTTAGQVVGRALALGPLPSAEKHDNFQLERRVELPEDRPGFGAYIEYYKSTSDEGIRFAVTILQNQTVETTGFGRLHCNCAPFCSHDMCSEH